MTSRFSLWAICLLAATVLVLPQAAQAQCTNASFSGTFQFNEAGIPFIASVVAEVSEGTLVADGAGHFIFNDTAWGLVLPGTVVPIPGTLIIAEGQYTGTYQVNGNCTMSLVFDSSNDNCFAGRCLFPIHFDAVLVKGGTGFYLIATDPGVLGSGAGVKI